MIVNTYLYLDLDKLAMWMHIFLNFFLLLYFDSFLSYSNLQQIGIQTHDYDERMVI